MAHAFARLAAALAVGLALVGCYGQARDAFTIVNRTTVPVVVGDGGSISIVGACSERTLEWHGTWGGGSDYRPRAEPVPSGGWLLPREIVPHPIEGPVVRRLVITRSAVGENADGNVPCDGVPPMSPAPASVPALTDPSG